MVAWLALVFSVCALGWQAWIWFRAGEVVRVDVVLDTSFDEQVVRVTAVNIGRGPTTIVAWGFAFEDEANVGGFLASRFESTDLEDGKHLAPTSRAVFSHDVEPMREQWRSRKGLGAEEAVPVRGWVVTATGKRVNNQFPVSVVE